MANIKSYTWSVSTVESGFSPSPYADPFQINVGAGQLESGSSTVDISVSTEGQGFGIENGFGSSTVDINVSTEGQGFGIENGFGSSTVDISVSTEGTGELALAGRGSSTVIINVIPQSRGATVKSYAIFRRLVPTEQPFNPEEDTLLITVGPQQLTYNDTSVSQGEYEYQVFAEIAGDYILDEGLTFDPANLQALADNDSIQLSWNESTLGAV